VSVAIALAATRPAEPFGEAKQRLAAALEEHRAEILDLSHRIHANPEPAFEERQAAAWVGETIARHGFTVEQPAGRLETAVRGRLSGGQGGDGPRIGILAEYDALPGLGHGCGHNTMAASGVGAAIALASIADELPGEIVFLGCPAAAPRALSSRAVPSAGSCCGASMRATSTRYRTDCGKWSRAPRWPRAAGVRHSSRAAPRR